MSRSQPAARNAEPRTVVVYSPDPHGAAMFSALTAMTNGALNGARAVTEASPTWYGWTKQPQKMTGAAGLGAARPYAPRNSELSRESTTGSVGAAAIFQSRMMRGQS
jgi:hypothetical protein